ncbi:hypothetical protein [Pseudomonas tolaasii]|uniref:hypothetical protein n=1 Tax=Pseudomonas tolaasii TaxID=29442 RepID=UPI0012FE5FB1|nr:hypothetical protein [Pseudomonas tolaasii]
MSAARADSFLVIITDIYFGRWLVANKTRHAALLIPVQLTLADSGNPNTHRPGIARQEFVMSLSQAKLKELLHYNPITGVFTWVIGRSRTAAGTAANTKDRKGYLKVVIDKKP